MVPIFMIIILTIIIFLLILTACYFYLIISKYKYHAQIAEIQLKTKKKTNEEKIKFYTSITQKMRTPLFMISALVEEIKEYKSPPVQIPLSQLDSISRNSEKLNRLISHFTGSHKINRNQNTVYLQNKNIVDFCRNLSEDYCHLCEQKNICFQFLSKKDDIRLDFDPDLLESVLTILISNAFKSTNKKGTITLELEDSPDKVIFSIKKNRAGMAHKRYNNTINRFLYAKQVEYERNTDLIRKLIKQNNDTVHLKKSNTGSSFIFELSKHMITGNQKEEDNIPTTAEQPGNPTALHSILIIEKPDITSLLERTLSADYKIYKAPDGEKGLEIIKNSLPDIIICDLTIPKIDGIQLSLIIKADKKLQHIKIIILTAKDTEEDRIEAFNSGADAYLIKPVSLKYLKIRIKNIIDQLNSANSTVAMAKGKNSYNKEEQLFLLRCREIIDNNLTNENFNIDRLADKLAMSHSSLYKKIKAMTGMSLIEFINGYKIYKSVELFNQGQTNIDTVCERCGFNDSKNFRELFKREMKVTPKQYVNNLWHKS